MVQGGAPLVINWFINPMNTIVISPINHSEIGVMFTNLANELGHHLVGAQMGSNEPSTREETHLASGAVGNPEPLQIRVASDEAQALFSSLVYAWGPQENDPNTRKP